MTECVVRHEPSLTLFLFFFTLVTGPRRSLSLKLSDTRVYEPQLRARLGTTAHFCEPQPPTLAKGWCIGWQTVEAVSSIQYAIDRFRNLKP